MARYAGTRVCGLRAPGLYSIQDPKDRKRYPKPSTTLYYTPNTLQGLDSKPYTLNPKLLKDTWGKVLVDPSIKNLQLWRFLTTDRSAGGVGGETPIQGSGLWVQGLGFRVWV